jgi:hypothetical protein
LEHGVQCLFGESPEEIVTWCAKALDDAAFAALIRQGASDYFNQEIDPPM